MVNLLNSKILGGAKLKKYVFTAILLLTNIYSSFALDPDPGEPGCGSETDPDGNCNLPLDTWVYVLVIAAVIYGAYRLHQKQKALAV